MNKPFKFHSPEKKRFAAAKIVIPIFVAAAVFIAALHLFRVYSLPNGGTPGEIAAFLRGYGWDVSDEPYEIRTVQIPEKFSAAYQKYNEIQKNQGFDLKRYRAEYADNYSFKVNNHPATNGNSEVYANVLVANGKIIGGDICSYSLNGFMTGFKENSPNNK